MILKKPYFNHPANHKIRNLIILPIKGNNLGRIVENKAKNA
jgi:hypothetical protein